MTKLKMYILSYIIYPKPKELLTFMYGSLMVRLIKDLEQPQEVNIKIEEIGYNIGRRLIDDVIDSLNYENHQRDQEKRPEQIMEELIKICLYNFFKITDINIKMTETNIYSLTFVENPLNLYVDLPEKYKDLIYSNIICGILRGMLEIANFKVECSFEKDTLKRDKCCEIKLKLLEIMVDIVTEDE